MRPQVRNGAQRKATGKKTRRLSARLLGGLLCAVLVFSAAGQALAGHPGREGDSAGIWAILSAQASEAVAQSRHFVNDVRLLYRISQLEPLAGDVVLTPRRAPIAPDQGACKLIAVPEQTAIPAKLKSQS